MVNDKLDLQKQEESFIAQVKDLKGHYDKLFIFGAGKVGTAVGGLLHNWGIAVDGYCVSDKLTNRDMEGDLPVFQIDEINNLAESALFLVGVRKKWQSEIIDTLQAYGYTDYILPPTDVELFNINTKERYDRPVLEITPKIGCKVNCRYCPQKLLMQSYFNEGQRRFELTIDAFKYYIDKTPSDLIVDFAGFVEPFLASDAVDMMIYASDTGRDIELYTTLVGLTKEKFDRIRKIPFRDVVLHIPDLDGYADIPMTDEYFEVLDLVLDAKKPNGMSFVDRANCQSSPHPEILKHTKGKLRIFSELYDRAGNLADVGLNDHVDIDGPISCGRSRFLNHNILLPDGKMVLCCMDFGLRHTLGDLNTQTYEEIMKGEEIHSILNRGGGYIVP